MFTDYFEGGVVWCGVRTDLQADGMTDLRAFWAQAAATVVRQGGTSFSWAMTTSR